MTINDSMNYVSLCALEKACIQVEDWREKNWILKTNRT